MIAKFSQTTALALIAGLAFSAPVRAADEGMIDLGPILDAMGQSGLAPAEGEAATPAVPPAPGTTPEQTPVLDADPGATLPALVRADAATAAAQQPESGPLLLPLTTTPYTRILRMSGEVGRSTLWFDVDSPGSVTDILLALRSSVSLLPAQSQLTFSVNGVDVLSVPPTAFDDFEKLSLPVEEVVAGRNRIDVEARGAHRIFCGPDASFEIWTEIDLGQSGVALNMPPQANPAGTMRNALAAQILRTGRVTVQSTGTAAPAVMQDLRRRLGAVLPGAVPTLVQRNAYTPVEAGAGVELAYIALVPAASPFVEMRQGGNGGQVLVIGGTPDAAMLDQWLPQPQPVADIPAIATATLGEGAGVSLAALGHEDILLESRYSKAVVPFTLPDDWFLIAAQEAHVRLDYTYAANLPEGSLMLVKVNGTTVRLLPLYGQGNTILPTLDVGFPVRLLSAGANELSFEAIVPGDPPELPCGPVMGPMVRIGSTTLIEVPPSPAMDLPRVSEYLRGLTPDSLRLIDGAQSGAIGDQVVSALSATLTPLAGVAPTGATLTVSGLGPVDQAPLAQAGVSRQRLEFVLSPQIAEGPQAPAENPILTRARSWGRKLMQLAWPGDPGLDEWLDGKTGDALVFLTDDQATGTGPQLWLVVAPTVNPMTIAHALADARFNPAGPKGEAALLRRDGTWENWMPAERMPRLLEPVTLKNFRPIAGNYASWNPLLFVGILTGLVIVTVALALSFITRTRGQRKR